MEIILDEDYKSYKHIMPNVECRMSNANVCFINLRARKERLYSGMKGV